MFVAHILQLAFSVIILHVGRVPLPPTAVFVVTWHFLTCGIDAFIIRHHTHKIIFKLQDICPLLLVFQYSDRTSYIKIIVNVYQHWPVSEPGRVFMNTSEF